MCDIGCCASVRYPVARVRQFVDKMHAAGQHWAPIFNPGISTSKGYRAYEEGTAEGLWIKDVNGKPYVGQVRRRLCNRPACWDDSTDRPPCYVGVHISLGLMSPCDVMLLLHSLEQV